MSAAELILFIGVSVAFIAGVFALAAMFGARARKFRSEEHTSELQSQA